MNDLVEKFLEVERVLNTELLEREEEIRSTIIAPIAQKHIFLLGPPGVAKSFLLERFIARISGLNSENYFKWLLTRFTNDAELFGPFALSLLEQDIYRRKTDRKLPKAVFFYGDEIFKASSSILNALLKILNEGEFDNDTDDPKVPLISGFFASNELPTTAELNALADRLHIYHLVENIKEDSNLVKMLQLKVDPEPEQLISLDDIYEAQKQVQAVVFPEDLFGAILELREHLAHENVEVSDRRLRQSMDLIKASAWLNGHSEVEVYDMKILQHTLWRNVADIEKVRRIVLSLTDPLERQALETLEQYNKAFSEFDRVMSESEDPSERTEITREVLGKWKVAKAEWREFRDEEKNLGRMCKAVSSLEKRLDSTITTLVQDGLGLGMEDAQSFLK